MAWTIYSIIVPLSDCPGGLEKALAIHAITFWYSGNEVILKLNFRLKLWSKKCRECLLRLLRSKQPHFLFARLTEASPQAERRTGTYDVCALVLLFEKCDCEVIEMVSQCSWDFRYVGYTLKITVACKSCVQLLGELCRINLCTP